MTKKQEKLKRVPFSEQMYMMFFTDPEGESDGFMWSAPGGSKVDAVSRYVDAHFEGFEKRQLD